jgi:hypothetical protein
MLMAVHVKDRTQAGSGSTRFELLNPEIVERAFELVHIINCDIEVRVLTHGRAPSSIQATHTSSHREKKDSVLSGRNCGTIRAFVQNSDSPSYLYVDRSHGPSSILTDVAFCLIARATRLVPSLLRICVGKQ